MMVRVDSLNNSRVRRVLALQRSTRRRLRDGLMVAEGVRLCADLATSEVTPVEIFCTPAFVSSGTEAELLVASFSPKATIVMVTDEVMGAMADTLTPQGILGIVPIPTLPVGPDPQAILIPDQLRDPGNLGTMLRTAWAAGATQVLLPPGTVDYTSPKVVRAAMGAHFHLAIRATGWDAIAQAVGDARVWVAEARRGRAYWDVDWRDNAALVIGGEAEGAGADARRGCHYVHIPLVGAADSLNAAVAAGILLFEMARQRSIPQS